MTTNAHRPGIFLSHSHADKAFARRLSGDLARAGARVWIDDAEILVGDSLIEKIRAGIDETDYLGVILSPESVASEWVRREVDIALNEEIDGRRIKVLPLLHKQCALPGFLKGKLYADFSSEDKYDDSLARVLRRLGLSPPDAPPDKGQRLNALKNSYALLAAASDEVEGDGISKAAVAAIVSAAIPAADLSDFWRLIAERAEGWKLYGVASGALQCVDKLGVGHDTVDYALEEGRLDERQRALLGMQMQYVSERGAVLWCHDRMVSKIRDDAYYHSFVCKHGPLILQECRQAVLGYLLYPNRGPGNYNVDTFYELIMQMDDPRPLVIRWLDWLNDGRFDGNDKEGDEGAEILYKILDEAADRGTDRLDTIREETHERVYYLLKDSGEYYKGLYHLVAMLTARYKGAEHVRDKIMWRVETRRFSPEESNLFHLLEKAFKSLVRLNESPADRELEKEVRDRWMEVADVDKITGFWTGSKRFPDEDRG